MNSTVLRLFMALTALAALPFPAFAGEGEEKQPRWYESLNAAAGITTVIQGTSGNDYGDYKDRTDYAYSADVELSTEIKPGHGFFIVFETGDGDGANDNLGSRSIPNYDAFIAIVEGEQRLNVSQAYYEGAFAGGAVTLDIGKMDHHAITDTNAYANDETAQFVNGLFVRSAGVVFPEHENYYAYTIALTLRPVDFVSLIIAYAKHETEDIFNKGMTVAELGLHPVISGSQGNYRIVYLNHDNGYTDYRTGESKSGTGFVISADQALGDYLGVFARYAQADDTIEQFQVKSAISGGAQVNGSAWGLEADALGIAYGKLELNKDLVTENNDGESVAEVYYRHQVAENFGLTADGQFFSNLERPEKRNVSVFSLRAQADF